MNYSKKLVNSLIKVFPNISEVKSLASYILNNPEAKKEELMAYWYGVSNKLDKIIINKVINIIESSYPKRTYAVELFTKELLRYAEALPNNEFLMKFLVDVNNNKIYIVPATIGHLKIAASILRLKSEDEIYKNSQIAGHIVGCYILIRNNKVSEVLIGATSGLVLGAKVKYSTETINKAYNIMSNFVYSSPLPFEAKIRKIFGRR